MAVKIRIPETLTEQVRSYRKSVRATKIAEAVSIAAVAVLVGFTIVFVIDRFIDAGLVTRSATFLLAVAGIFGIPLAYYRWVQKLQTLESVAKLLSKRMPRVGDSLLGALELSHDSKEQNRSPALCQAALDQVAADTAKKNLLEALPVSHHKRWSAAVALLGIGAIVLTLLFPAASLNAWARLCMPWASIDRYTFTALAYYPTRMVVPHGEVFPIDLRLASDSQWKPSSAKLHVGESSSLNSDLSDGGYSFEVPPQLKPVDLSVLVGDAYPKISIQPSPRPELEKLHATIKLPDYLSISEPVLKEIRGGALVTVSGSRLELESRTTKPVVSATSNGKSLQVSEGAFRLPATEMTETTTLELQWTDADGLQSKSSYPLQIEVFEDQSPTVFADGLPKARVMLESEQIEFRIRALDDFGVKQVGMEWSVIEEGKSPSAEKGELMLAAGSPTQSSLEALATFQATAMKIPSKPIELRLFAEDYLLNRGRVYSSPHLLYVLTPADHAVWVLDQMTRWQRESLEVRDRELQLLATNKQIRDMPESERNTDDARALMEQQSAAEQANSRRLNQLTAKGEELLRQAARNKEIGVGHLEKWAEMQQILKDIAANRMPNVADLLKKAARSETLAKASNKAKATKQETAPTAGQDRSENSGGGPQSEDKLASEDKPASKAPSVIDKESSQQPIDPKAVADNEEKKKGNSQSKPSALRLPSTTVAGTGSKQKKEESDEDQPAEDQVEEAVDKQLELLAEFDKVADELNELMANLEGSTLTKRLKSAAREQLKIADTAAVEIKDAFGATFVRLNSEQKIFFKELQVRENKAADFVSAIVDDMQGFHERRPSGKFESVLAEVKQEDVIGGLRGLSERILNQQGIAIAEAEYWSDTLDRWAEDIVDPASKGECKGSKSKSSLPPSIVLEVMQILEAEMNLRERTRVTEQAKSASTQSDYIEQVKELASTQFQLKDRIDVVKQKIAALPDATEEFGKELQLMESAGLVMLDASLILNRPETGKEAIAAETEVIELLLQTKRTDPNSSGGGGGTDPGTGGGGTTDEAAIAMIGPGINQNERRQDSGVTQQTGSTNNALPEEFRFGLDEYFQRIDRKNAP
ncbi:MAG: hypothetical protein MUC43_06285 [Pirellula sp.]|jgi:hypothetical protein|nr:hypothetical protein [Pirellula sp.]